MWVICLAIVYKYASYLSQEETREKANGNETHRRIKFQNQIITGSGVGEDRSRIKSYIWKWLIDYSRDGFLMYDDIPVSLVQIIQYFLLSILLCKKQVE